MRPLFLSCMEPRLQSPEARNDLAHGYEMHRTVCRLFDGLRREYDGARVLYRVENLDSRQPRVLIQSPDEPRWERLLPGYAQTCDSKRLDPTLDAIGDGDRIRFRLFGQPLRCEYRGPQQRGERRATDRTLEWMERRLERIGCESLGIREGPGQTLIIRREKRATHLRAVQFDGFLRVSDQWKLREAVRAGVGHGKAFGLGMLSVAACHE